VTEFKFELDIDELGGLNLAETETGISTAVVSGIEFFKDSCTATVSCTDRVSFEYEKLGVSKHEKELAFGRLVQVEETTNGFLVTMSKQANQLQISTGQSEGVINNYKVYFGDLKMIINLAGSVAKGNLFYKNIIVGEVSGLDGQYTIEYINED